MNILEFMEHGIRLEEIISRCYESLAESCPGERTRELMLKISREEINHANTLRLGLEYIRKMPDLFGPQIMTPADLLAGNREAEKLLEDIISRPELPAQLERLLSLERQFENVHMNTAVEIKEDSLKKLFENLGREELNHTETVIEILSIL